MGGNSVIYTGMLVALWGYNPRIHQHVSSADKVNQSKLILYFHFRVPLNV